MTRGNTAPETGAMGRPSGGPDTVAYEDVDDIIAIVSEMTALDDESLSVEDVEDVARQLEIAPEYVRPAIETLRRRRKVRLAKEAAKTRGILLVTLGLGALVSGLVVWVAVAQVGLTVQWTRVELARSQVVNVVGRQAATRAQWAGVAQSEVKQAELSGAENRVRIERKRYDAIAADYNAKAAGFPASVSCSMFGTPCRASMFQEVGAW